MLEIREMGGDHLQQNAENCRVIDWRFARLIFMTLGELTSWILRLRRWLKHEPVAGSATEGEKIQRSSELTAIRALSHYT